MKLLLLSVVLVLVAQSLAQYNGTCAGVSYNSTLVCSGNGTCIALDTCNCKSGFYGSNCEAFNCGGLIFNSTESCGVGGQCTSPENCLCSTGYSGAKCENWNCFGVPNGNAAVCGGSTRGTCQSVDYCQCKAGYFGHLCEAHNCGGTLYNSTTVCSGRGVCASPDKCNCVGSSGNICQVAWAPQKCRTTQFVPTNSACSSATAPNVAIANYTNLCIKSSTCDPADGLCRKTPDFGQACTADSNCTQDVFPLPTASLSCINNKCSYKKHVGLPCLNGLDCRTGICVNSTCVGLLVGQTCNPLQQQCIDYNTTQLYCNPTTTKCTAKPSLNDSCVAGLCVSGLECASGKCVPTTAVVNATCNPTVATACHYKGLVNVGLSCYPTSATTGKCDYPGKGADGSLCLAGGQCHHQLGCLGGKCITAGNVTCLDANNPAVTNPGVNCGSHICDCSAGPYTTGKCSTQPALWAQSQCAQYLGGLATCLISTCPGNLAAINPYDYTRNCGALCTGEAVKYLCCLESVIGTANFVKPNLPYVCPSAPTQAPTITPTTRAPAISSSSKIAGSLIALAFSTALAF